MTNQNDMLRDYDFINQKVTKDRLIEELITISTKLDGKLERFTTHDSTGRQSKKIVIEYDIKNE